MKKMQKYFDISQICAIFVLSKQLKHMTWNEFRKFAQKHGWRFYRHGSRHDIYCKEGREDFLEIERHWDSEMKPGIQKRLRKQVEG